MNMSMNIISRVRTWAVLMMAVTCLGFTAVQPARADAFTDLLDRAKAQLQSERFVEGLATSKDAVRIRPKDYRAHYYVSLAHMGLNRYDDADSAAATALREAPATAKESIDRLMATIKTRRQSADTIRAADAALAEGLAGKAARLYEQAWNEGRHNIEAGLKAADLYTNSLRQTLDAGRVYRQVKEVAGASPAGQRADAELQKIAGPLRQLAQGHVETARKQQGEEALRSLRQAQDADPGYGEIYLTRARIIAEGSDADAFKVAVKDLFQLQQAQPENLASLPRIDKWMETPAVLDYFTDLMGRAQADALRVRIQKDKDDDARIKEKYARDLAAYEQLKIEYEQDVQREKDRMRSCQREMREKQETCVELVRKNRGRWFGQDPRLLDDDRCYRDYSVETYCKERSVRRPVPPKAVTTRY